MSNTIRQSNIFGDYDWKIAYDSFMEADYASYDYDTIYQSMVSYIQKNYNEEFNDYIRHSELLAHVNMLAYLGQSLALRNDVNILENFMDDAKRRESVIKIASSMTYRVKRNIAASGQLKITGLSTTDSIVDSNGNNLQNIKISWDQKGSPTWYDSFIKVIESTFKSQYRFGKPFKRSVSGTRLEIYELHQAISNNYVVPFTQNINGETVNFEIVPSDIDSNMITERTPSSNDPFTIIYKNNNDGNSSPNTGFFVLMKQGTLLYKDYQYKVPRIDRSEIIDTPNINDSDVWVQEINENGHLKEYWNDIPNQLGQNIIYNEIDLKQRNIYFSKTLKHDMVEILYGDGNFSLSPTNSMRVLYRQSENAKITIRKHDITDFPINIPYINNRGVKHTLTIYVTNLTDINNADVSETLSEIKKEIVDSHYRQERMVTLEDYNIFPLERNPLRKLLTKNRNNADKSRYPFLDTIDPTGMHSNTYVDASDGYLYSEYYEHILRFNTDNLRVDQNTIPSTYIEPYLNSTSFKLFYMNTAFIQNVNDNHNFYIKAEEFPLVIWSNKFNNDKCLIGNFVNKISDNNFEIINPYSSIKANSKLLFVKDDDVFWTTVFSIDGELLHISDHIPTNAKLHTIIPNIETVLSTQIKEDILILYNKRESFGLRYDDIEHTWIIIPQDNIINSDELYDNTTPQSSISNDNRWLVKCIFNRDIDESNYEITFRGERVLFGSDKQVRFFFKNTEFVDDIKTGLPSLDHITIKQHDETYGLDTLRPTYDKYIRRTPKDIIYLDDMDE